MKDWETIAAPRAKRRSEYPASPAAGPGIIGAYRALFERASQGKQNAVAMVLGATPELRDLALEHGCLLISVEVNEKIMREMTALMTHANDPRERVIIGDWLKNPAEDNAVDVVMGDGIGNNVPYAEFPRLFSEIARVLKPGGYCILRDALLDPARPRHTIKDTIAYAHQMRLHKYDLFMEIYFYTTDGGYDAAQKFLRMEAVQKKLEAEVYGKGLLTPEEEEHLKTFMSGSVTSTAVTEQEYRESMAKFFDPVEVVKAEGFRFCEFFKFFYGRAKK